MPLDPALLDKIRHIAYGGSDPIPGPYVRALLRELDERPGAPAKPAKPAKPPTPQTFRLLVYCMIFALGVVLIFSVLSYTRSLVFAFSSFVGPIAIIWGLAGIGEWVKTSD